MTVQGLIHGRQSVGRNQSTSNSSHHTGQSSGHRRRRSTPADTGMTVTRAGTLPTSILLVGSGQSRVPLSNSGVAILTSWGQSGSTFIETSVSLRLAPQYSTRVGTQICVKPVGTPTNAVTGTPLSSLIGFFRPVRVEGLSELVALSDCPVLSHSLGVSYFVTRCLGWTAPRGPLVLVAIILL